MSRSSSLACVVAALAWFTGSGGAAAQETRAEAIQQEKDAKAASLSTYEPGFAEKMLNYVQEEASAPTIGFYPVFDSIYTQSAVSLGVGYRYPFGDTGAVVLDSAYSLRGFWRTRATLTLPKFWHEKGVVELRGFLLDAKKVRFYGVGDDSRQDDLTYYGFRGTDLLAEFRYEPSRRLAIGAHVAFDNVNTRGGGSGAPSIDEVFTPDEVPALGEDPRYMRFRVFGDYRWQEYKGYTRRGGRASASMTTFRELDDLPYDFTRINLAVSHHIPIYRENWVLAFRGLASMTTTPGEDQVPYFLLPALGESSDEFRGYSALRFRDTDRLLLTGEYRWMASNYLDLVLFADAGKVASRTADLNFSNLTTAWGVGARLHTPQDTVMHLSAARGKEGWRFIFGVGPVF